MDSKWYSRGLWQKYRLSYTLLERDLWGAWLKYQITYFGNSRKLAEDTRRAELHWQSPQSSLHQSWDDHQCYSLLLGFQHTCYPKERHPAELLTFWTRNTGLSHILKKKLIHFLTIHMQTLAMGREWTRKDVDERKSRGKPSEKILVTDHWNWPGICRHDLFETAKRSGVKKQNGSTSLMTDKDMSRGMWRVSEVLETVSPEEFTSTGSQDGWGAHIKVTNRWNKEKLIINW